MGDLSSSSSAASPSSSSASTAVPAAAAQRCKGIVMMKPIVYGNISRPFGKKRESDGHTHEWTVYVKPFVNEDMSNYVKKVHFKLHESYANPNRIISKQPYEVSETGWGEFEVQIKIHFHDACGERPVTLYHLIKLFPTAPGGASAGSATPGSASTSASVMSPTPSGSAPDFNPGSSNTTTGKKAVVSEVYDEIVFTDPTQHTRLLLSLDRPITFDLFKHETDFAEKKKRTLEAIRAGRARVQAEIADLREKLELSNEIICKFKTEVDKVQRVDGSVGAGYFD